MYLGIDIGGTKTLVATLSDDGVILESQKFPSDKDYDKFIQDLGEVLAKLQLDDDIHICAGVAGLLDRETGVVHALGNLPWVDKPIRDDISKLLNGAPLLIENDARLAALSEAQLLKDQYEDILFLTISTGIGGGFIQGGRIARALQDTEMGKMPLFYGGAIVNWEEFAGGRSLKTRFNKMAAEITDPDEWRQIGENIAYGVAIACSVLQPDVVVLGGSVGAHADKFQATIMQYLDNHLHPVVKAPQAVVAAQRPDEAVIYGCYDLAKQTREDAGTNQ